MEQSRKFDEARIIASNPNPGPNPYSNPNPNPNPRPNLNPNPDPARTRTRTRPVSTPSLPRRAWRRRAPGRTTRTCSWSCAPRSTPRLPRVDLPAVLVWSSQKKKTTRLRRK
jgi:hypothetical protein